MKYIISCLFLMPLLLASPSHGQQKGVLEFALYPLQVGTTWVYKAGSQRVKIEVEKHEVLEVKKGKEVQKVPCARLLVTVGGRSLTEHVAVQSDGLYRFTSAGKDIAPGFCFLKMSKQDAGETWQAESSVDGMTIKGTFTRGVEEITLPVLDVNGQKERNKRLMAVTSSCPEFQDASQKKKLAITYWFAEGLGVVKQRVQMEDVDHILELVEFKAGKAP